MDDKYKLAHEAFVKNPTGSTILATSLVLNIIPISVLFQRVMFASIFDNNVIFPKPIRFMLEFMTIIMPFLAAVTFNDMVPSLLILMLISSLLMPLFAKPNSKQYYFDDNKELLRLMNSPRKGFIEEYRAFIMIATVICILAVDFPVFPRSFAKTETFGISLMDIGVGSVVLSGAMVSRNARSEALKNKVTSTETNKKLSRSALAYHAFVSNLPLMALGFIRLVLTKSTNYQEHVTEYGIHWNFFFTLGFVSILLSFLKFSPNVNLVVGIVVIGAYQILLSQFGLSDYILNHPRDSLIAANKEGICSLAGYLSLHLIGTKLGASIFGKERTTMGQWRAFAMKLMLAGLFLFGVLIWAESAIQPISRRMTNLTYVLAILALNIFNFSLNMMVSLVTASHIHPSIIAAGVNRNQLFVFLLANILTGIVNFSMHTIYATQENSMYVIAGYTLFLTIVPVIMDYKNITIKLF
ncbi:hypothetical protein SAMD00019534_043690, partial [Acytostelium subglobosum LB1]|uniref:hypothetical protein n=1 Tax=Acytostelium subglobosum LB1 TaxID=1410327 RepID=UPI000644A2F6